MAKKQADQAIDLRAELKKRVKIIDGELQQLDADQKTCINERAHLRQYYVGKIARAVAELSYLNGLLDA